MKKMSKDNLLRAGVSLILSLLLWVYAVSDSNPMSTQSYSSIAIQYIGQDGLSANHLMLQSQITSVNITLYGRSQQLSKVKSSALYATADLSGITEEGTYTLQLQLNGIPGNITLSGISSEYITVDVIPIYEKHSTSAWTIAEPLLLAMR
jgi:YbbR domain-containing protein